MPIENTSLYKVVKKMANINQGELFKIVLDNEQIKSLVKFLNTTKQMRVQHVDSTGAALFNQFTDRTTYSLFDKKGRGGKDYELFDTGKYQRSFVITVTTEAIIITSDPIKDGDNLFDSFGKDIEGLTPENLQILINEALELYVSWFRKNILP